jgi:hypothetical protein
MVLIFIKKLKLLLFIIILEIVLASVFSSNLLAFELTGYVVGEGKYFFNKALYSRQQSSSISIAAQPELYQEWQNNSSLIVTPFLRIDSVDAERSHFDIRELIYQRIYDTWELDIGIGKVFWGVTEFVHLVDIINQTDLVEHLDGEEKLGQPMAHLSLVREWGVVDMFILPFFRERTFPGRRGRLRSGIVVDTDHAKYESSAEQYNIDLALRYSNTLGEWDFGIYHFAGTGREPTFSLKINSEGRSRLIPYYDQINQTGIDVQTVYGSWLYKLEALHRSGQGDSFFAYVGGFEYTFINIASSGIDLGVISEWAYDDRDNKCTTGFDNDLMMGARVAFNDAASSEALMGWIQDINSAGTTFTLEASRRITNHWRISLNAFFILDSSSSDIIHDLRNDDYLQLELFYYF